MNPKDDPARDADEGQPAAGEPGEVMSLFDLFLEPAEDESLDVDQDDTAIIDIEELRRRQD